MEMIVNIFKQLGVDDSIFIQFGLVFVLFFLVKILLMSRLQEVLELREEKTTKLEGNANKKFLEAEELSAQYEEKISEANIEAQKVFEERREQEIGVQRKIYEEAEAKTNTEVSSRRSVNQKELSLHKEALMKEANSLSETLVEKFVK